MSGFMTGLFHTSAAQDSGLQSLGQRTSQAELTAAEVRMGTPLVIFY